MLESSQWSVGSGEALWNLGVWLDEFDVIKCRVRMREGYEALQRLEITDLAVFKREEGMRSRLDGHRLPAWPSQASLLLQHCTHLTHITIIFPFDNIRSFLSIQHGLNLDLRLFLQHYDFGILVRSERLRKVTLSLKPETRVQNALVRMETSKFASASIEPWAQ